jgi:hypothetical protein
MAEGSWNTSSALIGSDRIIVFTFAHFVSDWHGSQSNPCGFAGRFAFVGSSMMIGRNTQCDFEFPFGPPATQIEHGKPTRAETMPKKAVTLDAHFCQLTFTDQARATLQIRHCRWLVLGNALALARAIRNLTNP